MGTDEENEKVSIVTLSYPFEYPTSTMTQDVKPLYIKAYFVGKEMNIVLVDNKTGVNLLLRSSLRKLGKRNPRLIPTNINAKYNALFSRDWIHTNKCVPSSLHQKVMIALNNWEIEEINADLQPFIDCAVFAEAKLYTEGVGTLETFEESKDAEPERVVTDHDEKVASKSKEAEGGILKYKDCFTWSYNNLPGLDTSLVEHRLPVKPNFKPYKQKPRRMSSEVVQKVNEEITTLLKAGFIRTARYVEWLSNIVPMIKKNGKLRVFIDFRNLNLANPKDEYPMPVVKLLVDNSAKNRVLSMMDGHSGYNQICIAEEDVHKTAFKCPKNIGTFE
ncbi:uncharacterized protein LOC114263824 [Camellia sinensis]|uniref:uncharacterized protein LOC114263824 n=1 Tax=Camellia sinensis TaxID=4442 RepID=UPI001035CA99|nr:uncharacterized protein LOC114263824 [Camellia sinensis]